MSLRDRRELGVNFFSVLKAAKEVTEDPEFQPTSRRDIAEKILEKITGRKIAEFQADPRIDLNGIIDFIMAILPIIMPFLLLIFGI